MAKKAKNNLKQTLLIALLAAFGGVFSIMSLTTGPSQAHGLASGITETGVFYDEQIIRAFYTDRGMQPVWIRGPGQFQPRLDGVVALLEQSWSHGFNPEKYHVSKIKNLMKDRKAGADVELDMLLSDAVIRYARDLTGMRNKTHIRPDQAAYWRQSMPADEVITKVFAATNPIEVLRNLEPNNNLYNALRKELMSLATEESPEPAPIKISKRIKPGRADPVIPHIRERFGSSYGGADQRLYDDELAARVMRFQRDYGLEDDGVIGPEMMAALNLTRHDRIRQIVANMERLRWLDQTRPDRYVLVNIPSAILWAVDDGKVSLEMPVIVGKSARKTESFKTVITGVRLNPNWTVPPTIKRADFLPMLREDPYSLTERGFDMRVNGRRIDPGKVDWHAVGPRELAQLKIVQAPGEDNPLGKIRVIMDNPYNIYLHDTNNRDLFDKKERALSSGCIRVAEPKKLAEFLFNKNADMAPDQLSKIINSGRMRDVPVAESTPVYITYQTIWLDSNGRLIYGRDVYGQDEKLAKMLEKNGLFRLPTSLKST